ncbi:MAG: DUF1624 domain-containing protein [Betaproteobacteria bacterium]|nr:DUF1624 domain-containing protein [Betaproteobacteria bacterium]MDE1980888.1 DUF1624 domain-containing protein [Betaproteobacteria bacterium]MDE2131862.1 DUF1624 domain-containing protein [Betaproteobacteria bacterium]MDE2211669.1 DUF1624 domain-containing protein [Betaproteobacteria bacterium]
MARHPRVDLWRGCAVLMMVAYHGCYDLTYFGYAHFRMLEDPRWIAWRTVIVASFVLLSGLSMALAREGSRRGFLKRLLQVGGCAALVSMATSLLFGPRWIYFGVLHFFFAATLLTEPLRRYPATLAWAGTALFVAGWTLGWDAMNPRTLNWIGFASQKPFTEDYAPLAPWLGLLWIGFWAGCRFPALAGPTPVAAANPPPALLRAPLFLGRHSLAAYMLHQPLLFALLFLIRAL